MMYTLYVIMNTFLIVQVVDICLYIMQRESAVDEEWFFIYNDAIVSI